MKNSEMSIFEVLKYVAFSFSLVIVDFIPLCSFLKDFSSNT